ncbi:uncharacterized protein BDV17DRAFT_287831 [Aspergillus undulatus]|uniref:uncharacterized protein n=1 Tax=Aspergillus undulatus TaxID=1810928 RepID=UPI003CCDF9CE
MSDPRLDIKYDWRLRLEVYCTKNGLPEPKYNTFSDRRGGRTAWSCHVIAKGRTFAARYWFDGDYVQNAMEDAAEVALKEIDREARQQSSQGPPLGSVKFDGA